jgi:flagellar biosynthetic protein FlhB
MSGNDSGDKTEKATPKRMKELRKEGSLQRSQDLSAWVVVGSATLTLPLVLGTASSQLRNHFIKLRAFTDAPDPYVALEVAREMLASIFVIMAPMFGAVVLAGIVAGAAQGGIHFSPKKLKPSFKQFNPKNGFKRVFGGQAWWNGAKAALKAAAIGAVLYTVVQGIIPVLLGTGAHTVDSIMGVGINGVNSLVKTAVIAGLALAGADMLVVMKRNRKQTRMSKKEIKDEHKNTEGDPLIKGQIRQRQIQMSRNRMMAEVTNADVVLVNPTHVAVALRYEPGTGAPRVIAKGKGHIAAKIRKIAADKRVPMVQDIALARAIHAACDLGQEIPPHLYNAVARVLAFVMALKRRGAASGMHRNPHAEAVAA